MSAKEQDKRLLFGSQQRLCTRSPPHSLVSGGVQLSDGRGSGNLYMSEFMRTCHRAKYLVLKLVLGRVILTHIKKK